MTKFKWFITFLLVFIAIVPSFYFLGNLRDVNAHDNPHSGNIVTTNEEKGVHQTDSSEIQIVSEFTSQPSGVFEHSY